MELEKNEIKNPVVEGETPKEKAGLLPVAFLALLLAPAVVLGSFFVGSQRSTEYTISQPTEIRIFVLVNATEFLQFSERNVCDGSGEIAGLSRSEVQIRTSSWIRKMTLGQGTLNADGACEYRLKISPPLDFDGGNVIASARLPLGKAKDLVLDTGSRPSFKQLDLTYDLG